MARRVAIIALVALSAGLSLSSGHPTAAPERALSPTLGPRAGDLDRSFDRDGKVITDFGGSEGASGVAVQADSKVIAAGSARDPASNAVTFAVARYNRTGSPDSAFGSGGKARTEFAQPSEANALAIQPDGKIVLAGMTGTVNGDFDFALARYNHDGTLDSTFGVGGKVTTDLSQADAAYAVTIQADGKIVIAGRARVAPSDYDFAVVRYDPNGGLDTSFGGVGYVITPLTPGYDVATAALVQPDGKIVAAGVANATPQATHLAIARYNPDGTLDRGFNGDGKVEAPDQGWGTSIAIQADAKLVVADGDGIARYNPNGNPDTTFGSKGKVVLAPDAWAYVVLVQPDRKLVVAGGYQLWPNIDFLVARFQPDGSIDMTFGDRGWVYTDVGKSSADLAVAAVLQSDRRIVVAGSTAPDSQSPSDFALVRYLNPAPCRVPNVRGKKLAIARTAITNAQCSVGKVKRKASKKVRRNRVISQSPKAKTTLPNLGKVNLVVSRGRK